MTNVAAHNRAQGWPPLVWIDRLESDVPAGDFIFPLVQNTPSLVLKKQSTPSLQGEK
jgi:hypothetical protein